MWTLTICQINCPDFFLPKSGSRKKNNFFACPHICDRKAQPSIVGVEAELSKSRSIGRRRTLKAFLNLDTSIF